MGIYQPKNEDVIFKWALQVQPESKTRNCHHIGASLYNYGTEIARIVEGKGKASIALVSSDRWSDTTTALQNLAAGIADKHAELPVYRVPRLGGDKVSVGVNLAHYTGEVRDLIEKLRRGRETSVPQYMREILETMATAAAYGRAFGRKWVWTGEDPETVRKEG